MDRPTPRRPRPSHKRAGFTLLEVLVAVAILSLSLSSLLSSQMASLRNTDYARQLSSVAFLAEWQLTEIEWELKQDGWGVDDQTFEGDFSDQGSPDVSYVCVVDLIEMPDYNQLVAAKDASEETDGDDDVYQDAGDSAFGALGMVWPIVKEAIEQAIRKSWCTVRWNPEGRRGDKVSDEPLCGEDEMHCVMVATFWTDPEKLKTLPALGGEADAEDESRDGGGDGDGGGPSTGRPSGGGGRPGGGGGGNRPPVVGGQGGRPGIK